MSMVQKSNAEHYVWGNRCDGWYPSKADAFSVIQERIPPGASETRHYHRAARQFFYVLSGVLSFEIDDRDINLESRQGIEIAPSVSHRVLNRSAEIAESLVISNPPSHGDRVPDGRGRP
jgi:mannose-6-phosphate isomerase-like protein (cupin superfamily)